MRWVVKCNGGYVQTTVWLLLCGRKRDAWRLSTRAIARRLVARLRWLAEQHGYKEYAGAKAMPAWPTKGKTR